MQLTNFIGLVTQTMGPEAASQFVDAGNAVKQLAEWYEVPQEILIDETARQIAAKEAQAMQMQQMMMQQQGQPAQPLPEGMLP
jgi:hypothetical protein